MKRRCRSQSIPGDDVAAAAAGGAGAHAWQPKASSVWKPIPPPLRAHYKHAKHRHSPLVLHKPKARRASPGAASAVAAGATAGIHHAPPLSMCNVGANMLTNVGSNRQSPAVAFQFLGNTSAAADNVATPLESPVPRPASASSGFYDSSASQTSLNTSWTDNGYNSSFCFSPPPLLHGPSAAPPPPQKLAFLKCRSLSNEEPISNISGSNNNTHEPTSSLANQNQLSLSSNHLDTLTNQNAPPTLANQTSAIACGSMPNFTAAAAATSVPVSPRRQRLVPR